MDEQLTKAKQILTNPNFRKLNPQQIQEVYRTLLASGLSKDDLRKIIIESIKSKEISYLENMPYSLFLNFILAGEIQGKDLISLCNSSPLINEKCNREFNAEGKIIPQYLFYLLLKRINIPVNDIKKDYRTLYKDVIFNKAFFSLKRKLEILQDATVNNGDYRKQFPPTIYDLLYASSRYEWSFLGSFYGFETVKYFRGIPKTIESYNKTVATITNILEGLRAKLYTLDSTYQEGTFDSLNVKQFAKILNLNLKQFEKDIFDPYLRENIGYIDADVIPYITFSNLVNYDSLFNGLLLQLSKYIHLGKPAKDAILENWKSMIEQTIEEYEERMEEQETEEDIKSLLKDIELLKSISDLSSEESDYLVMLHEKVLSGKLPVSTSFKFEELIKY